MSRRLSHAGYFLVVLQTVLQALTLGTFVPQSFLLLPVLLPCLLQLVADLINFVDLLLESLFEVVLDHDSVFLEVEQVADILVHRSVLLLQLHHTRQTLHEELHRVAERSFELLVVANERQKCLAIFSASACGQVNSPSDFLGEISGSVVDNLLECFHERVERVGTVQLFGKRQLAHKRNGAGGELLEPVNELPWSLVSDFELVDFKGFPCIHLASGGCKSYLHRVFGCSACGPSTA